MDLLEGHGKGKGMVGLASQGPRPEDGPGRPRVWRFARTGASGGFSCL